MTLFWHNTGPKVSYVNEVLEVEDLNPQVSTRWYMSRWEMFCLGWKCIVAAIIGG
jgi:hypothetical protein